MIDIVKLMKRYMQFVDNGCAYPWEYFEMTNKHENDWRPMTRNVWFTDSKFEFRPKQFLIMVGGEVINKPETLPPCRGTKYFVPNILSFTDTYYSTYLWADDKMGNIIRNNGLVHLTPESADAHARALINITKLK